MSEIRDILNDTVTDRQGFTADTVINLRTGQPFRAEIEPIQDIELNTELGRDAREAFVLHVQNRAEAMALQLNDRVQFTILGLVVRAQILRRADNPVSLQTDFGCMKLVAGKDA